MHARATRRAAVHAAVAACLATLTITVPNAAAAADTTFPVAGAGMEAAMFVAMDYWGKQPCGGVVTRSWVDMPRTENAISRWTTLQTDPYAAPEANTDCRVEFNRNVDYDWAMLCSVAVHEVGHLLGHDHTNQAGHVMTEIYAGPLPVCVDAARTLGYPVETDDPETDQDEDEAAARRALERSRRARAARKRRAARRARLLARRLAEQQRSELR